MLKVKVYNQKGSSTSEKELPEEIFKVKENEKLLAQAVFTQLQNQRQAIAHAKTRGEVSGGGKKPFKQKGTGNARAGSTRSPLWTGGGVTFGPRNTRNFSKRFPKKMKRMALKMLLSWKLKENKLVVLKDFSLESISTKKVQNLFEGLPIEEGKILVVLPKLDANIELSMANIPYVKLIKVENLNVIDLAKHDYIVTTLEALTKMEEILFSKAAK